METLGDFLKHGRDKAGLSLDELADRTRIRVENLRSLEREDLDSLPTDAYVRGFVRQVCRELGLEPTDGIIRLESLRRQSGPPDETTWAEESAVEEPGFLERALKDPDRVVRVATRAGKWAGLALGAAVVIVVGVSLMRDSERPEPAPPRASALRRAVAPQAEARQVPPAETQQVPPAETQPQSELPATVPPPVEAPAKTLPQAVAPTETRQQTAPPPKPAPLPVAQAPAVVTPAKPPAAAAPAQQPPAATTSRTVPATPTPAAAGQRVLRVEALRPVEVSVLLDGVGAVRQRTLVAGEIRTWKADKLFVFSASDGGAVRLFFDGEPMGTAGPDGQAVHGLRIRAR